MKNVTLDCLTPRHLQLFGTIMQWFARYELLMQDVMATVAGSDSAAVMLLTRRLDFADKRRVLLDLLRHRPVPMDQFDRVRAYLVIPHNLTPLRNNIAHAAWKPGLAPTGVQPNWILRIPPSVKPSRDDSTRPGTYVEDNEDHIEYTLDDLGQIVESLAGNYTLFLAYLKGVDLVPGRA
ncbi:MAG: hypothetical protein ACLPGW_10520 [Roseiarcus sp.]